MIKFLDFLDMIIICFQSGIERKGKEMILKFQVVYFVIVFGEGVIFRRFWVGSEVDGCGKALFGGFLIVLSRFFFELFSF